MRVAAVVLAAGAGQRLGVRAKAALTLADGRTFVAAIATAARAAGCARVVAVAAAPHEQTTRGAAVAAGCDAVVVNAEPSRGMASSIAAGLAALDDRDIDVALVWPVDHPRVRAATVARVIAAAGRDRIALPRCRGRGGHPTAFGAALWPELARAAALARGARDVVARDPARVVVVAVDDDGVLRDVDTPEDLAGNGL